MGNLAVVKHRNRFLSNEVKIKVKKAEQGRLHYHGRFERS